MLLRGLGPQEDTIPGAVIPLYYLQNLVDRRRIELRIHACKAHVFPLALAAQ